MPSAEAAVVLLHGQPATHISWLPVRRLLPDVDILLPDRPGYGANPASVTDFEGNVAWLLRLLDSAGIERAVIGGHSWAGGVALLAAARHPDRVAGLLLVCSVGPDCLLLYDHALGWPLVGDALAYAALGAARPLVRHQAYRELSRQVARADLDEVAESLRLQFDRPVWRTFLAEQRTLVGQLPMLAAALPAIVAPTVVLSGARDSVIPAETPRQLSSGIARAQLRVVPGKGHMLPLEAPDVVARALVDLLAGADAHQQS